MKKDVLVRVMVRSKAKVIIFFCRLILRLYKTNELRTS